MEEEEGEEGEAVVHLLHLPVVPELLPSSLVIALVDMPQVES